MAQHDYVIANQGFPAFRSDLNDALAAIVSNNSGATEPTTMFAHQMWVDTAADPSILKIRNADNDAWITVGALDQTGDTFILRPAAGSATVPAYSTTSDTNTGVYFPGADRVGITTSGTKRVEVDASGRVGIGSVSTPASYQNINGYFQNGRNGWAYVVDDSANTHIVHNVIFDGTNNTYAGNGYASRMSIIDADGSFRWIQAASGSAGGTISFTEAMRISSGNLLVGTTTAIGARQNLTIGGNASGTFLGLGRGGTNKASLVVDSSDVLYLENTASQSIFVIATTNGVVLTNGATSWASASDERKKDIIEPITGGLDKVNSLRPVIGKYKTDDESARRVFLIAQDVQAVLPEAVQEDKGGDLLLAYTDIIPLLVSAVKDLKAELDTVKAELATLKGQ